MGTVNDPNITDLGSGWTITRLYDKAGAYYRVDGPGNKSTTTEDFYYAHVYAKRLGWEG